MLTQSRWFQEHGSSLSGASEPHVPLTLRSHCPHTPTAPWLQSVGYWRDGRGKFYGMLALGLRRQNFSDHRGRAEKDTLCLSDRKSVFSMPGHKTAQSPPTNVVFFTTKHMLFHITSVVNNKCWFSSLIRELIAGKRAATVNGGEVRIQTYYKLKW